MTVEDAIFELGLVDGSAPSSETNIDFGMIINATMALLLGSRLSSMTIR